MPRYAIMGDSSAVTFELTLGFLKQHFPEVCWPDDPSRMALETLREHGIVQIVEQDKPLPPNPTNIVEEGNPKLVKGQYVQVWNVRARSPAEMAVFMADVEASNVKRASIELQRTDYTQAADAAPNVRAAWAAYRDKLRSILVAPNPATVVWPEVPSIGIEEYSARVKRRAY